MEIRKIISCALLIFPSSFSGSGCREEFEISDKLCCVVLWMCTREGEMSSRGVQGVQRVTIGPPSKSGCCTGGDSDVREDISCDDRSQVHNDKQRSAHCSDSAAAVLPLVSYPEMVTNIRSNSWRDSWNRLGSWVLES